MHISDDDLKNLCLIEIEMLLQENRRSLTDFKFMPKPNAADMPTFTNKLIVDELNYNKDELEKTHAYMLLMLTDEQRCVHDKIMESVGSDDGGFFFLYGYGGIGKTFIRKTLLNAVRSKGLIALNAASSGITTLLLQVEESRTRRLQSLLRLIRHHHLRWKRIVLGQTWCVLQS